MLSVVVSIAFGALGCDKKQSAGTPASSPKSTASTASSSSTSGAGKTSGDAALKTAKEGGEKAATPALKVPPAQKGNEKAAPVEKGEGLSAEICKAACENAVKLSVEKQTEAGTKEQMLAFGKQDCQKQCLAKGTRKQAACMQGAKSVKDLANCSL